MSTMLRDAIVAPAGTRVTDATLGAGWEAWDRIVDELRAAGVEVSDTVNVAATPGRSCAAAYAHYDDGDVRVMLRSPLLAFTDEGDVLLPEESAA